MTWPSEASATTGDAVVHPGEHGAQGLRGRHLALDVHLGRQPRELVGVEEHPVAAPLHDRPAGLDEGGELVVRHHRLAHEHLPAVRQELLQVEPAVGVAGGQAEPDPGADPLAAGLDERRRQADAEPGPLELVARAIEELPGLAGLDGDRRGAGALDQPPHGRPQARRAGEAAQHALGGVVQGLVGDRELRAGVEGVFDGDGDLGIGRRQRDPAQREPRVIVGPGRQVEPEPHLRHGPPGGVRPRREAGGHRLEPGVAHRERVLLRAQRVGEVEGPAARGPRVGPAPEQRVHRCVEEPFERVERGPEADDAAIGRGDEARRRRHGPCRSPRTARDPRGATTGAPSGRARAAPWGPRACGPRARARACWRRTRPPPSRRSGCRSAARRAP
jgi:hypothetical protein